MIHQSLIIVQCSMNHYRVVFVLNLKVGGYILCKRYKVLKKLIFHVFAQIIRLNFKYSLIALSKDLRFYYF